MTEPYPEKIIAAPDAVDALAAVETAEAGAAVSVAGVARAYRQGDGSVTEALHDVGFELVPASVTAIIGPPGSGKSVLLHVIAGVERPDAGTVLVDGERVTELAGRALAGHRRRVGLVPQHDLLLPALTLTDNVRLPALPRSADLDRPSAADAVARARELLGWAGLGDPAVRPDRLSAAGRRRVAIARALMNRPALLLADEPAGGLHPADVTRIVDLLLRVRDETGATVLIATGATGDTGDTGATGDTDVAARCDRVIRLREGHLAEDSGSLG